MAKKVFIGVLAALMLFAFVACDGGTAASGTITMVEATTSKVYVAELDEVKAEDFTFTGYTITGEPVNIPANQFKATAGTPVDNEAEVTFVWGSTNIPVKPATVTVYSVDKWEVAAGEAKPQYFTVTSGTYVNPESSTDNDPATQKDADFNGISLEGVVLTAYYNDETETREVVVDKDLIKNLTLTAQFGKGNGNDFEAETSPTTVPATAGAYTIQVLKDGVALGTYPVAVDVNRVVDAEIVAIDDFALYTDGEKVYDENGSEITNLSAKIFVAKTMNNGQVLKAADGEVAWAENAGFLSSVNTATANVSTTYALSKIALKASGSTNVFAKYVGKDAAQEYVRGIMSDAYTPADEEAVAEINIADYVVSVVLPSESYSATNPITEAAITANIKNSISIKYTSGRTEASGVTWSTTPVQSTYTYYVDNPTTTGKVAGDYIDLTFHVVGPDGTSLATKTVTATLVASLT